MTGVQTCALPIYVITMCCKHANIQFEYTHCYYILQVCGGLNKEKWLDDEIRWKIGIGDKVRFWVDTWLEGNFGKLASKVIFNLGTKVGGGGTLYGFLFVRFLSLFGFFCYQL